MRTLLASLSLVLILEAPGIIFIHANLPRLRAQVTIIPGTELPKIEIGLPTGSDSERVTPSDQDVPVIDSEKQFLTYENTKYGFSFQYHYGYGVCEEPTGEGYRFSGGQPRIQVWKSGDSTWYSFEYVITLENISEYLDLEDLKLKNYTSPLDYSQKTTNLKH